MIRRSFEFTAYGANSYEVERAAILQIASIYGLNIEQVPDLVDVSIRIEVESRDLNGFGETVSILYVGYVEGRMK